RARAANSLRGHQVVRFSDGAETDGARAATPQVAPGRERGSLDGLPLETQVRNSGVLESDDRASVPGGQGSLAIQSAGNTGGDEAVGIPRRAAGPTTNARVSAGGPSVQRKCSCGGVCDSCRSHGSSLVVQTLPPALTLQRDPAVCDPSVASCP